MTPYGGNLTDLLYTHHKAALNIGMPILSMKLREFSYLILLKKNFEMMCETCLRLVSSKKNTISRKWKLNLQHGQRPCWRFSFHFLEIVFFLLYVCDWAEKFNTNNEKSWGGCIAFALFIFSFVHHSIPHSLPCIHESHKVFQLGHWYFGRLIG